MRIVVARCSVDYVGRLTAHLPEAVRLLMVKADGCVAIHSDGGAYKPLNWMNAPNQLTEFEDRWEVNNPKGERLTITILEVLAEFNHDFGAEPGLQKDGVEAHLQELLAERPWVIEPGLQVLRREYPTDIGPIDIVAIDASGGMVAIEIKRKGEIDGVEQLTRYLDRIARDGRGGPTRGFFVAQSISPNARLLAESRGIRAVEVDYDELRNLESAKLRLF